MVPILSRWATPMLMKQRGTPSGAAEADVASEVSAKPRPAAGPLTAAITGWGQRAPAPDERVDIVLMVGRRFSRGS